MALAERLALPGFLPLPVSRDATPWTILSWGSDLLHGMTYTPCRRALAHWRLSWGFCPYSAHGKWESTFVQPKLVRRSRPKPGFHWQFHVPATVPLQVFSTFQRFAPPKTVPPYFRQVALLGFALQGIIPFAQPRTTHRCRITLLAFLLLVGPLSPSKGAPQGALGDA